MAIHKFYKYKIYPKISNLRGATRLKTILEKLAWRNLEDYEGQPVSVLEKDWDNLIVIDACRYDIFDETFPELNSGKRLTVGSSSAEFIEKTFTDNYYNDIVYITANPHFHQSEFEKLTGKKAEDMFHTVFHTYKNDFDMEKGTVLPENVVRDVSTAEKLFPEKRKIVHFMQPHHPFVGDINLQTSTGFDQYLDAETGSISSLGGPWALAELGGISGKKVVDAYVSNLEFVMDYVFELADLLEGETFVTADHGNLIGEKGLFGHPYGSDAKGLREVPWFKLDKNS